MLFSSGTMQRVTSRCKYYVDLCCFHPDCGSALLKCVPFPKLCSSVSRTNRFKYFTPLIFMLLLHWKFETRYSRKLYFSRIKFMIQHMRFPPRFPRCLVRPQMSMSLTFHLTVLSTSKKVPWYRDPKGDQLQRWNGGGLFFHTQRNYRAQCVTLSIIPNNARPVSRLSPKMELGKEFCEKEKEKEEDVDSRPRGDLARRCRTPTSDLISSWSSGTFSLHILVLNRRGKSRELYGIVQCRR